VTAEGIRWCGVCRRCREGATNLCLAGYEETGFTQPGAFSGYLRVPGRLVHRLPPDRPVDEAALLEPAACVANAVASAGARPGQVVVVVGGGTLGAIAVQMLALSSPAELVLVEERADRRKLGLTLGATAAVTEAEAGEAGLAADVVVEAAGRRGSAHLAASLAERGGTVVLCGIPGDPPERLDPARITLRELHVHGVFSASSAAWERAARLYRAGLLDFAPLISHRLPLSAFAEALAVVGEHAPGSGKVLLIPDGAPGPATARSD
jgi:threonine dehydrogenase-like Zn-dependent dehydrogenase